MSKRLFFHKNYFKKVTLIFLFLIGLIIYFLQVRFLDSVIFSIGALLGGKFEFLASGIVESDLVYGVKLGIVEKLLVVILVLINYKRIVNNKIISPLYFNFFFLYSFTLLYFSTSESIINRFSLLFFWAYVIILCNLKSIVQHSELKKGIVVSILFLCIIKTYLTFNTELYKYSNLFFGKDSHYDREVIRDEHYEK